MIKYHTALSTSNDVDTIETAIFGVHRYRETHHASHDDYAALQKRVDAYCKQFDGKSKIINDKLDQKYDELKSCQSNLTASIDTFKSLLASRAAIISAMTAISDRPRHVDIRASDGGDGVAASDAKDAISKLADVVVNDFETVCNVADNTDAIKYRQTSQSVHQTINDRLKLYDDTLEEAKNKKAILEDENEKSGVLKREIEQLKKDIAEAKSSKQRKDFIYGKKGSTSFNNSKRK